jgi:hypothetical protein
MHNSKQNPPAFGGVVTILLDENLPLQTPGKRTSISPHMDRFSVRRFYTPMYLCKRTAVQALRCN